jgi:hypothetical protein
MLRRAFRWILVASLAVSVPLQALAASIPCSCTTAADHAETVAHPADGASPHAAAGHSHASTNTPGDARCAPCSACCLGAALPMFDAPRPPDGASPSPEPSRSAVASGVSPDRLDRPPSFVLA